MKMIVLYLLSALDVLNFSMILPIYSTYVIRLGGSHFFLGLVATTSAFISLIWKPIAGSLSDREGRRKILIWCLMPCLFGNLFCLHESLRMFFVGRILCAFGSPIQILLRTIASDKVNEEDTAKSAVFNKLGILMSLCFMGGALLGGIISEQLNGIYYIYCIVSTNVLISIVLVRFLPNENDSRSTESTSSRKKLSNHLNEINLVFRSLRDTTLSQYWDLFIMKGLLELSFGIMQTNLGLVLLLVFNIDGRYMSYIFTLMSVTSILGNIFILKLNDSFYFNDRGYTKIVHGSTLLIVAYMGLGLSSVFGVFICFIAVLGISRTLLDSALTELLLATAANDQNKGKVISMFETTLSLAELVSPMLASAIASIFGDQFTILLCTVPVIIVNLISYRSK